MKKYFPEALMTIMTWLAAGFFLTHQIGAVILFGLTATVFILISFLDHKKELELDSVKADISDLKTKVSTLSMNAGFR